MTMKGGYGAGGYGAVPYGSFYPAVPGLFDIFCFQDATIVTILSDVNVTTEGDGGSFTPDPVNLTMNVCSGGGEPLQDARIYVGCNVPDAFTVEWIVDFEHLPTDFTDTTNKHIYLGVTDAAGALVGFLFAKSGIAYTGSVSFPSGNLQLDCTLQVLPGSSAYVTEKEFYVIRAAADYDLGIVYFYMTKLADIGITGHQLRAVLPVIPYTSAASPPTDQSVVSVRGDLLNPVCAFLNAWCLGTSLIIPNLLPVADAGRDQAVRNCSIIQLDGSGSFDPEGASLAYSWRLIEGPSTSAFVIEGHDGITHPLLVPTGYTDKFHSVELGVIDPVDPIEYGTDGDVLLMRGEAYTIVGTGTDGNGFYVQVGSEVLPEGAAAEPFKVLRQRGIKDSDEVHPTFFPDKPGFYKFDLMVNDGALWSETSVVLVNVLESVLPRGCTPDLTFIFDYLSDFWGLVEDKERINTFWSALGQVAATEMFTLWQFEYSKSLRDIQRYFNRRWLHYDLLLPEPIPELTKTRILYGGITSGFMRSTGEALHGTKLVIDSPLLAAPVTLTITSADDVMPDQLATELQLLLQEYVNSGFTTHVIENRNTSAPQMIAVRIDAQFPFSIAKGTTLPFYTEGTENRHPSDASGAGVGYKGYKVEHSMEGLGLVEDDLLVLAGVAYRVASIQDDPADDFAYQRLVLKEPLPADASTTWDICSWVSSELLDFYHGLVAGGDYADFEVSEIVTDSTSASSRELIECRVLGVNETLYSKAAIDAWSIAEFTSQADKYRTYLARVLRRSYVPVDELVADIPTMQRLIVIEDDTETLRRNVDYFIEYVRGHKAVRFVVDADGINPDVWETDRPPNRLWAEYTYFDNRPLIEANFGDVIGLGLDQLAELPDTVDYLSAVRGLWHSFYNGPTVENLRIGAQILLGLPFAEEDSIITEIRTDFSPKYGRLLLQDKVNPQIIRSYSYPKVLLLERNPSTGNRYAEGDSVSQFAPLVEGVEILDYVKDPLWFEGYLNQGVFYEVEKYHRFAVKVGVAAFNINTLLLVRNFVMQAKPAYTYPMFVVVLTVGETEVSTTDVKTFSLKLSLYDSPRDVLLGSSFLLDEPRCAGGGVRNRLDMGPDPSTWPTPGAVTWGLDKNYFLIPVEEIIIVRIEELLTPFTPTLDGAFALDTPVSTAIRFEDLSPGTIPAGPTGFSLTYIRDNIVPFDGTIVGLRFAALGDPGTDPTDYEVVISADGVDVVTQAFTAEVNKEVVVALSTAVSNGDAIGVRVRPATGGARTPNWSRLLAYVRIADAQWTLDDTLDAGFYCLESVL